MKLYTKPRRAVPEPASPPPTPPLLGSAELLAELDAFAGRAAASPNPGAAVTVVADFADDIADHLRDLCDVAGVGRPRGMFGPPAVADRSWHQPLAEAISTASKALGSRSARRREAWDAKQRRFEAQQHVGRMRTALRSANRRLDTIAANADARRRLAERGVRLTRYKFERS
ncbi:hypothetical protein [Nocardia cyriacigeorgica]|uniref:hypothetical protein n=1 Tax=Nocardia cyriacigeorgica TaxID=135487 RepID=UPI001895231D|nr:hypothetical protein [Nocardia cyriacigeorgica]MBF6161055.1 hypothetical protein [Nocardia cyriacigeorgica]MBF6199854.1 hypothetical protein [Nocardia cyriacigeorgica]